MFDKPAFEWLTACLGGQPDEVKATRLEGLQYEDWSRVLDLANQYGAGPMFYWRLKGLSAHRLVPKEILARSRIAYLENAARNMRIIHELGSIIPALAQASIPVIALKGAYLSPTIYGDIALRTIGSDVDLLVASADFTRAAVALRSLGYSPGEADDGDADWQSKKNITLTGPPGSVPIELHWTIEHPSDPVKVDLDGLWSRARPATVAGSQALALSREDLLLHLCLEATYHHGNWFQMALRPYCDILAVIQRTGSDLDWDQVEQRARQWRAGHLIHLALWLAREWLAAPVPENVLISLRPDKFDGRLEDMARELVFYQSQVPAAAAAMSWNVAQLGGAKTFADKWNLALKAVFPSQVEMAAIYKLPSRSLRLGFCYFLHFITLACKHAPAAWGLVFHKQETVVRAHGINALIDLKERVEAELLPASACAAGDNPWNKAG